MIRIAVVGEIGSGKSYASRAFGFPVFDADREVAKLYSNNKSLYLRLKKKLPNYIRSFPLQKKELLNSIIDDVKNLKIISALVHPLVRNKMRIFIKKNIKKKAVVLDIPLYLENNINDKKDFIIYIHADKSQIIKRLKLRKSFNLSVYKQLKKIQLSNAQKKRKSRISLKNNFNKNTLKKTINMIKLHILKNERNNSRY
mgnify:CR=1 FL=1